MNGATRPVSALRNLGPAMERIFGAAGITTAEALRALGPDEAYARAVTAGHAPHFMAFLALALGLQGRGIADVLPAERAELRRRFDALVVRTRGATPTGIEAELDRLGVRPARTDQPTISVPAKK